MDVELKHRLLGLAVLALCMTIMIPWMLTRTHFPAKIVTMNAVPVVQKVLPVDPVKPVLVKAENGKLSSVVKQLESVKLVQKNTLKKKVIVHKVVDKKKDDTVSLPRSGWLVQVGSFSEHAGVDRILTHLKQKGFSAFETSLTQAHKRYYRVFVGPSKTKSAAQGVARRLHTQYQIKGFVVHQ